RAADGFILQLADPYLLEWTVKTVRSSAEAAGRDPAAITICVAAPAYVGDGLGHARDQCRWFGRMFGQHVADPVTRYGEDSAAAPTTDPPTSCSTRSWSGSACSVRRRRSWSGSPSSRSWAWTSSPSTPCTTPARRRSKPTARRSSLPCPETSRKVRPVPGYLI